ncbi:MAG: hypothetical protein AVDCRST_MAG13-3165 [uncultured Solirubrobacteraceae bacterium]|uniref:Uncharacterized protein n=1 Tax=uncultured Solirubrobacteraceae bacterium TaxID=1162706 RepID=A0A6J4TA58_9ACTN|nr:MAG: hypothetical protein AVDCRST_MAG13-3165 [uncultured Solirubrobacteraceae bacterium]
MGSRWSDSMIRRRASSIRSSSSPTIRGAPAVSMTLPPLGSTSVSRKQTCWSSAASWIVLMSCSSASTAASGPSRSMSASVSRHWTNAVVTCRCSGGLAAPSTWARTSVDRQAATSSSRGSRRGRRRGRSSLGGAASRRRPGPLTGPTHASGRSAAAAGLTTISPASATFSMSVGRVAPGPARSCSRWEPPTRRTCTSPVCRPWDIRRVTLPAEVRSRPILRRASRMSTAAPQPRARWSGPSKSSSSASPASLRRLPPLRCATASSPPKAVPMVSTSSSAPSRPRRVRRSERLVKPETSAKRTVASSVCRRAPGARARYSRSTVGT